MKLDKYNKEDKIFYSKVKDKIQFARTRNQIVHTDFLNMHNLKIAIEALNSEKENNYIIFKPQKEADKVLLIIYANKHKELFILFASYGNNNTFGHPSQAIIYDINYNHSYFVPVSELKETLLEEEVM